METAGLKPEGPSRRLPSAVSGVRMLQHSRQRLRCAWTEEQPHRREAPCAGPKPCSYPVRRPLQRVTPDAARVIWNSASHPWNSTMPQGRRTRLLFARWLGSLTCEDRGDNWMQHGRTRRLIIRLSRSRCCRDNPHGTSYNTASEKRGGKITSAFKRAMFRHDSFCGWAFGEYSRTFER
jgi:hypothetical protein